MEAIDNKNKILNGASELFLRYGIRSISMDNIANHLGVSKKTIYQYFKDKNDMVISVTEAHVLKEREQMDEVVSRSKNAMEELVELSGCLRENFKDMNPLLLFDIQKYHDKAWEVWVEFKDHFIREQLERTIERGKEEGYYRLEVDAKIMAILRLETIQFPFDPALFPKGAYSVLGLQMQIFDHFIYGLFTDKGRKLYEKYKKKFINKENTTIQL